MAFHHIAFGTKDMPATHAFYTEVMGFTLEKCVVAATPGSTSGGWSKHFFYDTGAGGLMGFWEIADDDIGDDWRPAISTGVGLPTWVNHYAFDCATYAELEAMRQRWLDHGITVVEVDHDFCVSIYTEDPNGNMVEFCWTRRPFTDDERAHALQMVTEQQPELQKAVYDSKVFRPERAPV